MPAPKVTTSVEDQSTRVNANGTVNVGIVIAAKKGPINKPQLVTGQTAFLRKFAPDERLEIGWDQAYFEAYEYLKTQSNLYVVRAASNDVKYGGCSIKLSTSANASLPLEEGILDLELHEFAEDDAMLIYGADQGKYNNELSIIISTDPEEVKLEGAFLIKVYKKTILVETHLCSLNPALKNGYGVNCYVETVLKSSLYIRAMVNPLIEQSTAMPKEETNRVSLNGGDDGTAVTDTERIVALNTLRNSNDIPLQLIMDGGNTTKAYANAILSVCQAREDSCHGIISTRYEDEQDIDPITAIKAYRKETLNIDSESMELYTPHQELYDEFNDRYIYVSPSCYVAAQVAKYAQSIGWHWAVAGYNRGVIPSIDVAKTFEPEEVDILSDNQVNTIIKDPGAGNIIFDELTMKSVACDLQDCHISRYINIFLRPALKNALKPFLFEFNDEATRATVVKMLDVFMQPQKSGRAVYDYRIVCSEENNDAVVIQNNELNVWLYIKPTKVSKFINQKIIISPYSVNLESIEI